MGRGVHVSRGVDKMLERSEVSGSSLILQWPWVRPHRIPPRDARMVLEALPSADGQDRLGVGQKEREKAWSDTRASSLTGKRNRPKSGLQRLRGRWDTSVANHACMECFRQTWLCPAKSSHASRRLWKFAESEESVGPHVRRQSIGSETKIGKRLRSQVPS